MPFDSSGNYTLPSGTIATTGQTILVSQHNPAMQDIEQALTGSVRRSGISPMLGNLPMGGFKVTGIGTGSDPTDAATVAQVNNTTPVGIVVSFAGTTAPTNWLFCYGQAVSRTTYAVLFSTLGTAFGAGDGSTTFNLPDCRGRVDAGKDDMGGTSADRLTNQAGGVEGDTLGAVGGGETHTLTTAQLASHTHGTTDPGHSHSYVEYTTSGGTENTVNGTFRRVVSATSSAYTGISINAAGSGEAHNNVQPTIVFNKIIKAL